jgi:hypothetical protein
VITARCHWSDWPADVAVHELQWLYSTPECLMWEWRPLMLASEARLIDMLDLRQS